VDVDATLKPLESLPEKKVAFGDQLKTLRESVGLTQRQLFALAVADKDVGTGTVTAISHWEDGRRVPVPSQLSALLRVFREHGVADSTCWELVEAAAVSHHRYAGFLTLLQVAPRASRETKQAMFETWCSTFPGRVGT
jgi:transcriptional regulator with XRE-family HTH domain